MQILLVWFTAAIALVQLPSASARITRSDPVFVRAVIDGDTIDLVSVGRVRLLGIDAPEIGRGVTTSAPFGWEARERLASLVLRHWVRLEGDGAARDAYKRRLAYVIREDGLFVNAAIVRDGLARVTARASLARFEELKSAETEAQALHRGMWWGRTPQMPPASTTRRPGRAR